MSGGAGKSGYICGNRQRGCRGERWDLFTSQCHGRAKAGTRRWDKQGLVERAGTVWTHDSAVWEDERSSHRDEPREREDLDSFSRSVGRTARLQADRATQDGITT